METSILQYVREKSRPRSDWERKDRPSRMIKVGGLKAIYLSTAMEAWGNRSSQIIHDEVIVTQHGRKVPKNLKNDRDIVKVEHIVGNFFLVEDYYSIGD